MKQPKIIHSFIFKNSFIIFASLMLSSIIIGGIAFGIHLLGFEPFPGAPVLIYIILTLCLSGFVGTLISIIVMRKFSRENVLMAKNLEKIAEGNLMIQMPTTKNPLINIQINHFNKVIKELSSIKILKQDFISNFSHELKTPLVSINGFAELLLKEKLTPEEQKEYLQIIMDESSRLINLAKNILLISKLESNSLAQSKRDFLVDEQIRQSILMLDLEIQEKNLSVHLNGENVSYYGNEDLLHQVWINLLSNAIKFSKQKGQINIGVSICEEVVKISFTDNGIGMSPETIHHIFDQFYQGDTSHSIPGNGLGLSIVKKIIDEIGGKIHIGSQINVGTVINISLPIQKKQEI